MRILFTLIATLALATTACGGAESVATETAPDGFVDGESSDDPQGSSGSGGGGQTGDVEPEPAGAVEPNTIRIGSQVWKRTLPMTTGQCFLFKDDGTLPTSANVWGTLDGVEDSHFSASVQQDGTFEVRSERTWRQHPLLGQAGERSPKAKTWSSSSISTHRPSQATGPTTR